MQKLPRARYEGGWDVNKLERKRHAKQAEKVLEFYNTLVNGDDEDRLADLLCDLRHWCDANDVEFHTEDRRAYNNYVEEL